MYVCTRGNRIQRLLCADLEHSDTFSKIKAMLPKRVALVYSDPPWNPGNATYWRTHANKEPCASYPDFLDKWIDIVVECIERGARDVFVEQSQIVKHKEMFYEAIKRHEEWCLNLLETWTVYYGSPGSASVRRPNLLIHYGLEKIKTNPEGMAGEPMTIRVCAGLERRQGIWVVDPCMGKGMTSRMAVYFDWNAVGVELNQKRLGYTIKWLEKQGYTVDEIDDGELM